MNYIIVQSEFLEYVDFSSVKQDNPETLRYSIDGKHFLLKYEGEQPEFVFNITQDAVGLQEFTHEEIIQILDNASEWKPQD
tara:strand:- start:5970 stop:6212 length:243 start_codon:yes stop_codon:yes gene_type:complete